ncbi:MAG: c-type cytochrome [Steroidobacteraceae bacterium]
MSAGCARARGRTRTLGVVALLGLAGAGSAVALAGKAQTTVAPATDSGQPAISWTWTSITPKPGEPHGYVLFQRDCRVCHGSGPATPGTRALRAKYHGKLPALLEDRTDLTATYVEYIVRHGVSVMPPFRKTEVSDADLDPIAAYLARKRSAR